MTRSAGDRAAHVDITYYRCVVGDSFLSHPNLPSLVSYTISEYPTGNHSAARRLNLLTLVRRFCTGTLLFYLILPGTVLGQTKTERGLSFVQNFKPQDYGGYIQNWEVVQDNRGVIYASNSMGIIEYDGVTWRHIPSPGRALTRGVTVGADGLIYTGTKFGPYRLEPNLSGRLTFIPLAEYVPERFRQPSEIVATKMFGGNVWFLSSDRLLRWDGVTMFGFNAPTQLGLDTFVNNDNAFVFDNRDGLLQIKGDSLAVMQGSTPVPDTRVVDIVPTDGSGFIYVTRHDGLFRFDRDRVVPFQTSADSFLKSRLPYRGIRMRDHRLAIGTDTGGAILLDSDGTNPQIIDRASGLQNDAVLNLFEDGQNGLWLALDVGISRVELGTPLSFFGTAHGELSYVNSFVRHSGTLYIGTLTGLRRLVPSSDRYGWRIETVPGLYGDTRALISDGSSLLVSNDEGIFDYRNGHVRRIQEGFTTMMVRSSNDPGLMYVGQESRLFVLRKDPGSGLWKYDKIVLDGVREDIYDIAEYPDGSLSLGFLTASIAILTPKDDEDLAFDIAYLDSDNGLPDRSLAPIYDTPTPLLWEEEPIFWTFTGSSARPDSSEYPALLRGVKTVTGAVADATGRIWLTGKDDLGALLRYPVTPKEDAPIREIRLPGDYVTVVELEETDAGVVVWIGTPDRFFRVSEKDQAPVDYTFPTLVREIEYADSTYFWEAPNRQISFPWKSGDAAALKIHYAAPVYGSNTRTRYRYRLDGFSEHWSAWTTEATKTYSNLFEGTYSFHVEAHSEGGRSRSEGLFRFHISPPLYRTWWAYLGWGLMALGLLAGSVRWRTRRLEQRTLILESEVRERTDQLQEQTILLKKQADELTELDRTKSRFFANISHEFRTPLTLISGSLEDVISGSFGDDLRSLKPHLERARRSGRRLLRLVSQLLDLSRLEAGQQTSFFQAGDLARSLRQVAAMFDSFAESRDIIFVRSGISERFDHVFDPEKIEKVAINLLSNAFKFTPRGGQIAISLSLMEDGSACLDVTDTGLGIDPEHLERIFERFFMIDDSMTRAREGTGIGLALVREFVELHEGHVTVESHVGEGTRFSVMLPPLQAPENVSTEVLEDLSSEVVGLAQAETDTARDAIESDVTENGDESMIVLVVEDNADMREYIQANLENRFEVILAPDGERGLELARTSIPDLVLSDVMMPEMDGLELCTTLKNDVRTSHIPVILLTAKADVESRLAGLETGADAYLPKPFNSQELHIRIRALIEHRKRMQAHYAATSGNQDESSEKLPAREAEFVEHLGTLVAERMTRSSFGVDELADEMALSRRQLLRKMKALLGEGPNEMIRRMRLEKAATMLRNDGFSVKEIAAAVGFESTSYFSRVFAQTYGESPSAYTRKNPNA